MPLNLSRHGPSKMRFSHPLIIRLKSDRGSISILIFGLFSVVLITALMLTNISSIYISKRTLTLATEAAAQQGAKNLDKTAYYSGEYNLTRAQLTLLGLGEKDPGIPIDCTAGSRDAAMVLRSWDGRDISSHTRNLTSIEVDEISCDGFEISISASGVVRIPIPIPFIDLEFIKIQSRASAIPERADTNNYMGFDFG